MLFDIVETTDKLLIRHLQRIVGIELIQSGGIDDSKKKITQLLLGLLLVFLAQLGLELIQLFTNLTPDVLLVFPIETHVAGLVLNAVGLDERRQC